MDKVIVTTTVNAPTEAIRLFDAMPDWHLVVVGDTNTPPNYRISRGTYLGPADQEDIDRELSELIGWRSIQRRNFGLLLAKELGAKVVAMVDDDNVPLEGWGTDLLVGRTIEATVYETDLPAFDPVGATNYPHLWHRGFPLQLVPDRDYSRSRCSTLVPDVQADFWNGDPDVDAICRMLHVPDCEFDPSLFPIAATAPAPFDSQNTFIDASRLPDYFLFPHIGRMDDIWAAYHLQAQGATVVFGRPSVVQERNPHDLVADMKSEYLGYEQSLRLVEAIHR